MAGQTIGDNAGIIDIQSLQRYGEYFDVFDYKTDYTFYFKFAQEATYSYNVSQLVVYLTDQYKQYLYDDPEKCILTVKN